MSLQQSAQPSIVHIGPSHFFRGHFLPLLSELVKSGHLTSDQAQVYAVSLRSSGVRDELVHDNFNYHLLERAPEGEFASSLIENLQGILVYPEDPDAVIDLLAAPTTKTITLTVTAAGYDRDDDVTFDPHIGEVRKADSNELLDPQTGAVLAAALYRRYKTGAGPVNLMALDNGSGLSKKMKANISFYGTMLGKDFIDWVQGNVEVIDTMVDRITPNGEHYDPTLFEAGLPKIDFLHPVHTEPWPKIALVTGNVPDEPLFRALAEHPHVLVNKTARKYSDIKVRVLNGSHFALGMVGRLAGFDTTVDAMKNPVIEAFVCAYVQQIASSVSEDARSTTVDHGEYANDVAGRLSHRFIPDRLERLHREATGAKLVPRLLDPLASLQLSGKPHQLLDMVLAAWPEIMLRASQDPTFEIKDTTAKDLGILNRDPEYYNLVGILEANTQIGLLFHGVMESNHDFTEAMTIGQQRLASLLRLAREVPTLKEFTPEKREELSRILGDTTPSLRRDSNEAPLALTAQTSSRVAAPGLERELHLPPFRSGGTTPPNAQ